MTPVNLARAREIVEELTRLAKERKPIVFTVDGERITYVPEEPNG